MRASPRSTTSCAPFSISRTTRRCRRHVPQSLSRALDVVLADPNSAARIDAARIGGFGASAGDALLLDRWQPLPPGPGEALSVEYYNASLDHYFMTAYANEVSILDAGVAIPDGRAPAARSTSIRRKAPLERRHAGSSASRAWTPTPISSRFSPTNART
jgi:hypothetical protein